MDVETICRGLMSNSRRLSNWSARPRGTDKYISVLSCDRAKYQEASGEGSGFYGSLQDSKMTNDLEMIAELQTSNIDIAIADSNHTPTADNNASIDSVGKDIIPLLNLPIEKPWRKTGQDFDFTPEDAGKGKSNHDRKEAVLKHSPKASVIPCLNDSKLSKDSIATSMKHGTSIYEQILADIRFTKRSSRKSIDKKARDSRIARLKRTPVSKPSPKRLKRSILQNIEFQKETADPIFSPAKFETPGKEDIRLSSNSLVLSSGLRSRHLFASGRDLCVIYDSETDVRADSKSVNKPSSRQQLSTERIKLYRYKPRIDRSYSNLYQSRMSRSVSGI